MAMHCSTLSTSSRARCASDAEMLKLRARARDQLGATASGNEIDARLTHVLRNEAEHVVDSRLSRQLRARVPDPMQPIQRQRQRVEDLFEESEGTSLKDLKCVNGKSLLQRSLGGAKENLLQRMHPQLGEGPSRC